LARPECSSFPDDARNHRCTMRVPRNASHPERCNRTLSSKARAGQGQCSKHACNLQRRLGGLQETADSQQHCLRLRCCAALPQAERVRIG
jgi:hypothetical protein